MTSGFVSKLGSYKMILYICNRKEKHAEADYSLAFTTDEITNIIQI